MLWEGNRQLQEYTQAHSFTTVYDQDSFIPVARVVQANTVQDNQDSQSNTVDELKIYHYHTNHLGTPQELTNQQGEVVWLSYDYAWGGQYHEHYKQQSLNDCAILEHDLQPIRFQGQFFDQETELHYNRFRYYDSDVGMFIQRDPIGLLGGSNVFAYAPNPVGWVDPWGLTSDELVYRLLQGDEVVYYGITKRPALERLGEHMNQKNGLFDKMQVLAENLSYGEARTIEGALIRNRINDLDKFKSVEEQLSNAGLLNKKRGRVPERWVNDLRNPLSALKNLAHLFLDKPRDVNPCK